MTYRWAEHTAEVELEIEAPTEEAVFTEALHALAELLGDGARGIGSRARLPSPDQNARSCSRNGSTSSCTEPRPRISFPRRWSASSSANVA
jgi:hypothetical protein